MDYSNVILHKLLQIVKSVKHDLPNDFSYEKKKTLWNSVSDVNHLSKPITDSDKTSHEESSGCFCTVHKSFLLFQHKKVCT